MYAVGIRALRAELADVIRRAAAGESAIITSHGESVARIGPLDETSPDLDRLTAVGLLVPPRRTGEFRLPEATTTMAGTRVDQALRELRG